MLSKESYQFYATFETTRGSKVLFSVPDHIPDLSLLSTEIQQTVLKDQFTVVSLLQSGLVVLFGVFIGNNCHCCAECTTDEADRVSSFD